MTPQSFLEALQAEVCSYAADMLDERGNWVIKGFIDTKKRVYTMPGDTKVISKVIELFLIPKLVQFAQKMNFDIELAPQQNFYPDVSFISQDGLESYAVDIKSTYRTDRDNVNGMTLGAFTGYFRNRTSTKNTARAYGSYTAHLVLGVVYTKNEELFAKAEKPQMLDVEKQVIPTELKINSIDDLGKISSTIRDIVFFVQPKYRIATARPGSGNTKNIGSVTKLTQLTNGTGPFAALGVDAFDDYWMNYLTRDMARKDNVPVPYMNLETYARYRGLRVSAEQVRQLDMMDTGGDTVEEE